MSDESKTTDIPTSGGAATVWLGRSRLLFIGLWIGAAVFFSFGVAPSVFRSLPSRDLAGLIVQRTLALINLSGFFIGSLALLILLVSRRSVPAFRFGAEALFLLVMTAACGVGHWWIAARMHAMKLQLNVPLDLVPRTDPVRAAFDQLHGYSVMILTVAMVAALAAWLLGAGNTRISSSRLS